MFSDGSRRSRPATSPYTIERAIKLNWGGKSFFTGYVEGAADFDKGKAKTISGITADDATGKITITLDTAYGAFAQRARVPVGGPRSRGHADEEPLERPAARRRPVHDHRRRAEPDLRRWSRTRSSPRSRSRTSRSGTSTRSCVKITLEHADRGRSRCSTTRPTSFDAGDTLPPSLLPQITAKAKDRFKKQTDPVDVLLLPEHASEAVQQPAGAPGGQLRARPPGDGAPRQRLPQAGVLLPAGGHRRPPDGRSARTASLDKPDLAKAKQLVQQSGMAGSQDHGLGPGAQPAQAVRRVLHRGAEQDRLQGDAEDHRRRVYFPTIGNAKTKAQTGFADWIQDFPNPSDFYLLLDADSIQPTNNQNFSKVNDPKIQSELKKLNPVPADRARRASPSDWQELDRVHGPEGLQRRLRLASSVPQFFGDRIDFGARRLPPDCTATTGRPSQLK